MTSDENVAHHPFCRGGKVSYAVCNAFRWQLRAFCIAVLLGAVLMPRVGTAAPTVRIFTRVPAGMFAHASPIVGPGCGVEGVNHLVPQGAALARDSYVWLNGWVGDSKTGEVPARFALVLEGKSRFYVQAETGIARPDVVSAFDKPGLAKAGFRFGAYLIGVPVGDYQLVIYYRTLGKEKVCATHVTVSVQ